MSPPLLSIVVPTRGRAYTAIHCVRTALRMAGDDFEVVVRDCSETAALGESLSELGDRRVVYEHGQPCSMTDNWNAAMRLTSGKFVCYLGDDDGFLPWGLETLRTFGATEAIDCLASDPMRAVYKWPDFSIAGQEALLCFERFPARVQVRKHATKHALEATLRGRPSPPLPGVYHRIASRSLLEEIRAGCGDYFKTVIPDLFTYFASSAILDSYHVMDPPLSIAGSCGASNSSMVSKDRSAYKRHQAEYEATRGKSTDLAPVCGVTGGIADAVRDALQLFADERTMELFKRSYIPILCGTASGENPREVAAIFRAMQQRGLSGVSPAGRALATVAYGRQLGRFAWRHGDYTLRKLGLYKPAYDKALHRFEQVEDIGAAIDLVETTTLAEAR